MSGTFCLLLACLFALWLIWGSGDGIDSGDGDW